MTETDIEWLKAGPQWLEVGSKIEAIAIAEAAQKALQKGLARYGRAARQRCPIKRNPVKKKPIVKP